MHEFMLRTARSRKSDQAWRDEFLYHRVRVLQEHWRAAQCGNDRAMAPHEVLAQRHADLAEAALIASRRSPHSFRRGARTELFRLFAELFPVDPSHGRTAMGRLKLPAPILGNQ